MPGYGQFCPVAQALDLVGERWTLLIVRELLCDNYRFNELLNGLPLISRSLLSQRLKRLEDAALVERHERQDRDKRGVEYRLTRAGRELEPIVMGLGNWARRWVRHPLSMDDLDPVLMMWDLRRRLDAERLPAEPTVIKFWFRDLTPKISRYWLCIDRPEVELCLTNPGLDVALTVETKLRTMVEVWLGDRDVNEAVRAGAIELTGQPKLTRVFPSWLLLSSFAEVPRGG
jgi:DNA-binding HxlR family transcriptional regulator